MPVGETALVWQVQLCNTYHTYGDLCILLLLTKLV